MTRSQQEKVRPGRLKLSFLGNPEVYLGSQKLIFSTRKALALLVYLALEPGFHSRDKLVTLLWPEADQDKGRANLRMALARLRDDLQGAKSVLQIERDAIGIRSNQLDLDVDGLKTTLKQMGQLELDLEEKLSAAAQLLRGDLLEGFDLLEVPEFDDWLQVERERVRTWGDNLLERLALLQLQDGNLGVALETAQRRVRLEPLNEAAHRQLIELHLSGDHRSAALEAFNNCRDILQHELGLEPDAQTQGLLGRIHNPGVVLKPTSQTIESTFLVGRQREWAQMEAAWQAGQAIILHGVPGVGKSRLMLEFAASKGNYLHWLGRPGDALMPYGTHARTFRPLCEALSETGLYETGLPDWVRAELARIVPGLGVVPPPIASDAERLRFFEAKAEALEQFFAGGWKALVYDDLQFVDSASLEAALYILNRFLPVASGKPHPILGFRSEELSGDILKTLQQAADTGIAVIIEIKPLGSEAIGQMLESLKLSTDLRSNLHRFTGGNPLFVIETLRSLSERGGLEALTPEQFENRRRVAGLGRSPKVQAIIERRFDRLSPAARELASVAAIMGEYFSLELGAKVLGKGILETARLGQELEAARVLNGNRFSHDLIFETVLENISGSLRPILHKQVLEAFEARDIPGAVRLKHALGSESSQMITHYALLTAEEARKLYAHEEIFSLLEESATFVSQDGFHSQAARILTALAWTMILTGRINQSLAFHQKALRLYQKLGDTASLAQVHLQLSLLNRTLGNFSASQHYAQLALDYYRTLGDQSNTARSLWRLGEALWWQREFEQAQTCFVEAQELAQQLGDVEILVWVLKDLGQTAYFLDNAEEGLTCLQKSVELAKTLNDKIALGWVHFDKARVHLAMRQYPEATKHNQKALDLFEESGHVAGIRAARLELGQLAAIAGSVGEAKDVFIQNHKAVLESHDNDILFDMLIGDAVILQQQGDKESAAQLVFYILGQPQKDNPFAHERAKQILEHLEQELSSSKNVQALGKKLRIWIKGKFWGYFKGI